jgi:tetratricopeptide (TPR) repeat protein
MSGEARLKRHCVNKAISLAMQNRWEEAVDANEEIIEVFPNDADTYNRLGKALTKLGCYAEAREAYLKAFEIEPRNNIARKNLERLSHIEKISSKSGSGSGVDVHFFLQNGNKTTTVRLCNLASSEILSKMVPGDQVYLKIEGWRLLVENNNGEYLGEVDSKTGQRIIRLSKGGNKYQAAIANINENEGRIVIKETFQHPSQTGQPSFLPNLPKIDGELYFDTEGNFSQLLTPENDNLPLLVDQPES